MAGRSRERKILPFLNTRDASLIPVTHGVRWDMNERRRRILCVEDDRDAASLICEELSDRGFDVSVAYSGNDGLACILKDPPDIVLSDIGMPGMSGFELLEPVSYTHLPNVLHVSPGSG